MFSPESDVKFSMTLFNYIMTCLLSFGYGIACMIFYSIFNQVNCTTSGIKIQDWIIVCGVVYCVIPILHFSIFGLKYKIFAFIYYGYSFLLYLPFNIAWSIIGAVMLFQQSYLCLEIANQIWVLTLTVLIFQWMTIVAILWEIYDKYRNVYLK